MSRGKCADKHGVVLDMFVQGGPCLHNTLLEIFNKILHTGDFPKDWSELFFVMLPKGGDPLDPGNWRPIAILNIMYRVLGKLLSNRLAATREAQQPAEQFGIRPGRGTDDAFVALESVDGKAIGATVVIPPAQ